MVKEYAKKCENKNEVDELTAICGSSKVFEEKIVA